MVYGCGSAGLRIARAAKGAGAETLVAGRDPGRTAAAAVALDVPWRSSPVDDPARLAHLLRGVRVLVNTAGPMALTAPALMAACLRSGCHYVDVSNELAVFLEAWPRDRAARHAGVAVVPGAGFATAVVEALAHRVLGKVPDADTVTIVRSAPGGTRSDGVRGTSSALLAAGGWSYEAGQLLRAPDTILSFDLPEGSRAAVPIGSGEVFAVAHSSGVPNVSAYYTSRLGPVLSRLAVPLARQWARAGLRLPSRSRQEPTAGSSGSPSRIWLRASNRGGAAAVGWVEASGAEATAAIAAEAARRLESGGTVGVLTAGELLGPGFPLGIPGTRLGGVAAVPGRANEPDA
ncbi:saccharopine dehydrogenase NADP-binding domain-containing protein [Arthrobacter silvisoli]|uniref:saccharopine dehydrogenase NADP-binding domain-containing protein n=1 Tax=Arthrobacter silvisoli TaxID=2291022 RepID=UPI001FEC298A|nr:saccharopine dehydrogenase NADP-binding domain-containing protein [Arthrobacter silvisoli]